jgi:cation transport ATPase
VGVAYIYSVVAVLAPGLFPPAFPDHDGEVGLYFEADSVSVTLVLLAQVLELRARGRTSALLSGATMRNIKQKLLFAFLYAAARIPLAAGVLYPLAGWLLDPMIAALAKSLSSVSVNANALRLGRVSL